MKDSPKLDNRPAMIIMGNELVARGVGQTGNSKGTYKWHYYWDTI
ncbi:MAG: hypothetical protein WBC05_19155 [Sedimentisphaerales bacterium]